MTIKPTISSPIENMNERRARAMTALASGVSLGEASVSGPGVLMQESPSEEVEWQFVADAAAAGERLDGALAKGLSLFSRARVKDLIVKGAVSINGIAVEEPKHRLRLGDDVLLVVNKPVGMVVHPAVGNLTGTLVNALLFHCGDSLKGIGGVKRPGIVHRLDKDTSGVMVAAKTDHAHQH